MVSSDDVNKNTNLKANNDVSNNIKKDITNNKVKSTVNKDSDVSTNNINQSNQIAASKLNDLNYKEKTRISVASKSVPRNKYLYVYLKNSAGKGISGKKITITFANKKYTKTTNENGCCRLKMNYKATKYYSAKVKYMGSSSYLPCSKSFKVKVYKQKTKIIISSKTIIRGKYMHIFLKDANNKALPSKLVTITFNKKYFEKYTNNKGEVTLKIISEPGKYPVKIKYKGSANYLPSSKSFTAISCLDKAKIEISNSKILKGTYLYVYLKNSENKPISNQKIEINFNNKKFSKTTDSNGRVSLKIIYAKPNNYKTTIKYLGSTKYAPISKTLTITVVTSLAKIIATNKISTGDYSVRLVDLNGIPLTNKMITISTYNGAQSMGSGIKINQKTIILDSDNIYNKETDTKLLNDIAKILRSKGYEVIVNPNIGPNSHCSDIKGNYSNACIFCIFGGVDSGMFVDMGSKWYKYYLNKYNNRVVLGFTKTLRNLAIETFLERAHDDDYSPENFTGLKNPGKYLNEKGYDYVYGNTASQIATNFIKYATNGLSIGKDNILPCFNSYNVKTDKDGYATISGLSEGHYTIISSCSSASGHLVDSVTTYLTVKA